LVENSTSEFSGYASLYCATYYQAVGCYNSTFLNFTALYGNGSNHKGGNGENVVIEGSNNDFINGTIEYGSMAGYDAVNYNPSTNPITHQTPAQSNRLINSMIAYNSQRSLQSGDSSGNDPQVYCDGCSYFQAINNIVIGNQKNSSYVSQNAVNGIAISSEHPTYTEPYGIYLLNNLVEQNTYDAISASPLAGGTGAYNIWLIGNTFFNNGSGLFLANFGNFDTSHGESLHVYNNIFQTGNQHSALVADPSAVTAWDGNYNQYACGYAGGYFFHANSTYYTLSGWQAYTGTDANSQFGDAKFYNNSSLPYDFHLQRTSLGQANNSPAIGIGLANYANSFFNIYSLGTTRSDGAIDSNTTPDIGYHYNFNFGGSLNWNEGQLSTTYSGANYQ
jgi:hypothetical protein